MSGFFSNFDIDMRLRNRFFLTNESCVTPWFRRLIATLIDVDYYDGDFDVEFKFLATLTLKFFTFFTPMSVDERC